MLNLSFMISLLIWHKCKDDVAYDSNRISKHAIEYLDWKNEKNEFYQNLSYVMNMSVNISQGWHIDIPLSEPDIIIQSLGNFWLT